MFPPIQTGTSFYSQNLAETFTNKGHEVIVITANNDLIKDEVYPYKVVRLSAVHIPLKNFFKHLRFCSFNLWNYRKTNKIAKEFQTDIILLINHYLDIAFPAIYAARRNKIPLIISVGTQLQSNQKIKNKILKILEKFIIGKFIFPHASRIVSWDKEIERYIDETYTIKTARKSCIIPYGINGEISIFKNHIHDYNRIGQIVGIGAVIDQRNFLFAIRVFSEVIKYYPYLTFKIIGHEYIDRPRQLVKSLGIENNVIFMGEIQHNQVIDEIGKSFLGFNVASGYYTGLGTASLEIMLMGVPLIANVLANQFGTDTIFKDMSNIIYSDGINIEETVKKISIIIKDHKLREKIGQGGKKFVQENMNWDKVANEMVNLFSNHLKK